MRTDLKNAWIDALLSGDYDQVQSQLGIYKDTSYFENDKPLDAMCCLGVLCDVSLDYDDAPIRLKQRYASGSINFEFETIRKRDNVIAWLPDNHVTHPSFDQWAMSSVTNWDYSFKFNGFLVEIHLPSLNDVGFSFAQIADIIRWAEPDE